MGGVGQCFRAQAQVSDCEAIGKQREESAKAGRRGVSPKASEPVRRHGFTPVTALGSLALPLQDANFVFERPNAVPIQSGI